VQGHERLQACRTRRSPEGVRIAGERAVQEVGGPHLVTRTNFFGWSTSGTRSVLEFFVNALRRGEPVKGYPDVVVTSIYVSHRLQAIWDLTRIGADGLAHVASRDALSKHDFGERVADVFGLDAGLISPEPAPVGASGQFRNRDISLDTSRLAALLGTPPPTQVDGLVAARAEESTHGAVLRTLDDA
jgi:dTDP-4-dehydrorhamnose reductase